MTNAAPSVHLDGGDASASPSPSPAQRAASARLPLLLLVVAFAVCYGPVVVAMAGQWWTNTMYNYAFLIPAIAAYMVWIERERVARAVGAPSYVLALPVLAIGLGLLIVGRAGSLLIVEEFSILPTLAGVVLLAGGASLLRAVALPLAYLLFMRNPERQSGIPRLLTFLVLVNVSILNAWFNVLRGRRVVAWEPSRR